MEIPDTRYAITPDGVYLAYQVVGEGPVDLVWQFDFVGNVDLMWETPVFGPLFRGIAAFARLIFMTAEGRVYQAEMCRYRTSKRAWRICGSFSMPSDRSDPCLEA